MEDMIDVLRSIWAKQANGGKPYFFIATKRASDGKWKDHPFKWPQLDELRGLLEKYGTDKYNLYFCPLPFKRPYRRREYVMGSNFLWADIDEMKPSDMEVEPGVLWSSSPGRWAGLWLCERWLELDELENYNKRMTYGVGADKAGWDLTQVLRIPGTRNHKYKGSPTGKMLRMDLRQRLVLRDIPKLKDVSHKGVGRAREVYAKWEKKLRGETRSILTSSRATAGKRSDVLWKLYHQLFDAGVPVDEIRLMVRESIWNKFKGRRDEDRQIDREIEKCLGEKLSASSGGGDEGMDERGALVGAREIYEGISAADVEVRKVDWLWFPYISRGALTIVEGDPGLGKSYMMQMISVALCDGGKLPGEGGLNGKQRIKQGRVLYCSVEDDASTVIVPRLKWNGCENISGFRIYDRKLTMDEDGLSHAEYLVEKYKIDMVVFDTLNYFVGGIDVHRANEVSQQMEHFQRLAHRYGVAVVVLRHLTKASGGSVKAAYRGQGSIAFSGAAREVLTVGLHPDDHTLRIVAVTKLNLEAIPKALGYRIEKTKAGSRFTWSDELYDLTSDDIVDVRPTSGGRNERKDAVEFLKEKLADGAMEVGQLEGLAEAKGLSKMTLRRARAELEIIVTKKGFSPARWYWKLPPQN